MRHFDAWQHATFPTIYPLDFNQMFLDPLTGNELGHRLNGDLSQGMINLMQFIYELHMNLALGDMLKTPNEHPGLSWHSALDKAQQAMDRVATENDITVKGPVGLAYISEFGVYSYSVRSSRDISDGDWDGLGIWVDGDTGKLKKIFFPDGEHSGKIISNWLRALHFANWHDWLAYRILVCILGLVITVLSVTGVYIWMKKRKARRALQGKRARLDKELAA